MAPASTRLGAIKKSTYRYDQHLDRLEEVDEGLNIYETGLTNNYVQQMINDNSTSENESQSVYEEMCSGRAYDGNTDHFF